MSEVRILRGDALQMLRTLDEASFDACITDPPYHLTAGKKGGSGAASVTLDTPHGRARVGTGFMGMTWDGGDVAMRAETWAEVLRVLKPGAYLLAFGGTRTHHRIWCAIEDAGFEIRDTLGWLYGSGFPKGTDKAKIPADWKGWNTALKPAWEPICLARKPMAGTLAANLEQHGTGAMNINACRIPVADDDYARNCSGDRGHAGTRENAARGATDFKMGGGSASLGRWPANILHDGSDEVLAVFPQGAGAFHDDGRGTAVRFFWCPKSSRADRNAGCEHLPKRALNWSSGEQNPGSFQSGGTDKSAHNHHPTVKPTDLMRYLVRLVTPPSGHVLDPFCGSGSTGRAAVLEGCAFTGIELDADYVEIARARTLGVTIGLPLGTTA